MQKTNLNLSEEIVLYSDDEHVAAVPNSIDFEFEQIHAIRGIRHKITVFNGNQCSISYQKKHDRKLNYRFDIALLNPQPFREHYVAWKWLFAALGLLLTSLVMIYAGWAANLISMSPNIYFLSAVLVIGSSALISLLMFVHNSYDRVFFKSQFGRINVIQLMNKYPSKNKLTAFLNRFITQIKKARQQKPLAVSQMLANELKHLRHLRDQNVITEENYQSAKGIIFKHNSFNSA